MKWVLLVLALLISNDPKEIAKINSLKKEAEEAYLNGNFELAASKYTYLIDSMKVDEPAIRLNLAHSYYHLGDTALAQLSYSKLSNSDNKKLKSIAFQQLGVMSKQKNKLEQSLHQLKQAIKSDPTNQEARYNYEVVKKLLEKQKEQEQQQQQDQENQDQQNQDQEQQDQQDQEQQGQDQNQDGEEQNEQEQQQNQEEKENDASEDPQQQEGQQEQEDEAQEDSQEEMTKQKLEEMGLSEEKAKMLLEAMRQNEIKYLQYQRRKPTKRPPSGKPDW